jgi:V8-like Glu-specific endopeptidase
MKFRKTKFIGISIILSSFFIAGCNVGLNPNSSHISNLNPSLKIMTDPATMDLTDFIKKNPETEASLLAKATIGLETTYVGQDLFNQSACTGVAIAKNMFLTAAHCVVAYDQNKKLAPYQYKNITTITLSNNNKVSLYSNSISKVKYIKGSFDQEHIQNKQLISGDDLALVVLTEEILTNPVPINKILANTTKPFDKNSATPALNELDKRKKDGTYFTLGWGSHKKFQIRTTLAKDSLYGVKSSDLNWNIGNKFNDDLNHNNTNVIFSKNLKLEGGDSGGPTFICNDNQNDCKLIALNTAGNGLGEAYVTTLINPYFDYLYTGLNQIKEPLKPQSIDKITDKDLKHITDAVYGIRFYYDGSYSYCTGIAISKNQLLTAASCLEFFNGKDSISTKIYKQDGNSEELSNNFFGSDINFTFFNKRVDNVWRDWQNVHDVALLTFKETKINFNNYLQAKEFPLDFTQTPRAYYFEEKDLSSNHAYDILNVFNTQSNYISINWANNYLTKAEPRSVEDIKNAFTYQELGTHGSMYLDMLQPTLGLSNTTGNGLNKVIIPNLQYQNNIAGGPVIKRGPTGGYTLIGIKTKVYPQNYNKYGITYVQTIDQKQELSGLGIK